MRAFHFPEFARLAGAMLQIPDDTPKHSSRKASQGEASNEEGIVNGPQVVRVLVVVDLVQDVDLVGRW